MEQKETFLPSRYNKDSFSIKIFERSKIPAGSRPFYPHKHMELEIALFKSGYGKYKTSRKEYSIKPGDVFIFRSNEVHWISEIEEAEEMNLLNIQFAPHILWASNSFPHYSLMSQFISGGDRISNRLDRDNLHIEEIRSLILDMHCEINEEMPEYPLMLKLDLANIFIKLIRYFYNQPDDESSYMTRSNFRAIEASMNYIQEHLTENIKLEELASIANMSKTYYTTIFKSLNGVTPWDYIVSKRIDLAISLLQNGTQTMLNLALKCGFNSTANFNRAFKKYTGRTPTEFKNFGSVFLE